MNCRHARREMDRLLYGAPRDRDRLDQHLRQCEACRGELARLAKLDAALQEGLAWEPEQADLERVTGAILDAVARQREGAPVRPLLTWRRSAAACAAVCAVFVCGLLAGRHLFPREIVGTKAVAGPRIGEPVGPPIQVIEERVVTRKVPVVRTRVVYRDRPVLPAVQQAAPLPQTEHETVKAAEVAFPVQAVSWVHAVQPTHDLVPARETSEQGGERAEQGPPAGPVADPAAARVAAVADRSLSPSVVPMPPPD